MMAARNHLATLGVEGKDYFIREDVSLRINRAFLPPPLLALLSRPPPPPSLAGEGVADSNLLSVSSRSVLCLDGPTEHQRSRGCEYGMDRLMTR